MHRYTEIKKIGAGSFGTAILCKVKATGEMVVIKKISLDGMPEEERKAARREAAILSHLRHPGIVKHHESFEEGPSEGASGVGPSHLMIVTEYAENGDLNVQLEKRKATGRPFREAVILDWAVQISLVLLYMHSKKLLHRDLKLANVFLAADNEVRIGDFGIARVLKHTMECAKTVLGTPYYLSPEICESRPYNHKSDVWATGCVLYELCAQRHAFEASSITGLVRKILKGVVDPLPEHYSPELWQLIASMLQLKPGSRPGFAQILSAPFLQPYIRDYVNRCAKRKWTVPYLDKIASAVAAASGIPPSLGPPAAAAPDLPQMRPSQQQIPSSSKVASSPVASAGAGAAIVPQQGGHYHYGHYYPAAAAAAAGGAGASGGVESSRSREPSPAPASASQHYYQQPPQPFQQAQHPQYPAPARAPSPGPGAAPVAGGGAAAIPYVRPLAAVVPSSDAERYGPQAQRRASISSSVASSGSEKPGAVPSGPPSRASPAPPSGPPPASAIYGSAAALAAGNPAPAAALPQQHHRPSAGPSPTALSAAAAVQAPRPVYAARPSFVAAAPFAAPAPSTGPAQAAIPQQPAAARPTQQFSHFIPTAADRAQAASGVGVGGGGGGGSVASSRASRGSVGTVVEHDVGQEEGTGALSARAAERIIKGRSPSPSSRANAEGGDQDPGRRFSYLQPNRPISQAAMAAAPKEGGGTAIMTPRSNGGIDDQPSQVAAQRVVKRPSVDAAGNALQPQQAQQQPKQVQPAYHVRVRPVAAVASAGTPSSAAAISASRRVSVVPQSAVPTSSSSAASVPGAAIAANADEPKSRFKSSVLRDPMFKIGCSQLSIGPASPEGSAVADGQAADIVPIPSAAALPGGALAVKPSPPPPPPPTNAPPAPPGSHKSAILALANKSKATPAATAESAPPAAKRGIFDLVADAAGEGAVVTHPPKAAAAAGKGHKEAVKEELLATANKLLPPGLSLADIAAGKVPEPSAAGPAAVLSSVGDAPPPRKGQRNPRVSEPGEEAAGFSEAGLQQQRRFDRDYYESKQREAEEEEQENAGGQKKGGGGPISISSSGVLGMTLGPHTLRKKQQAAAAAAAARPQQPQQPPYASLGEPVEFISPVGPSSPAAAAAIGGLCSIIAPPPPPQHFPPAPPSSSSARKGAAAGVAPLSTAPSLLHHQQSGGSNSGGATASDKTNNLFSPTADPSLGGVTTPVTSQQQQRQQLHQQPVKAKAAPPLQKQDPLAHRVEALRAYLERLLGTEEFLGLYRTVIDERVKRARALRKKRKAAGNDIGGDDDDDSDDDDLSEIVTTAVGRAVELRPEGSVNKYVSSLVPLLYQLFTYEDAAFACSPPSAAAAALSGGSAGGGGSHGSSLHNPEAVLY